MTSAALLHLEAFLESVHPGFADDRRLHDEARALSGAYTSARDPLPGGPQGAALPVDAAGSVAYLAHFGPRAIVAVEHALSFTRVPASCIDVGAGSGASALALFFAGARRVTLVEQSGAALALARRLLAGLGEVRAQAGDLANAQDKDATLLLSAFAFGELAATPVDAFASLVRAAPQARALVLVDAGDRPRARRLQELRDHLAQQGRPPRAPCPHADPCPALVRERDWCHTRLDKRLPERLSRFARGVGRDDERMAASFLVIDDDVAPAPPAVLVIGEGHKEKGRARLPVCGPGGLRFVQALKRHRPAHDALLALPRGARLPAALAKNEGGDTAHVVDEADVAKPS